MGGRERGALGYTVRPGGGKKKMKEVEDDKKRRTYSRGAAMLVPCFVEYMLGLVLLADRMLDPGAYTSTHAPKLLNDDLTSSRVVEPTVNADDSDAGEVRHASLLELPAATTTTTPDSTSADTAELNISLLDPPRLMLTTQGSVGFASQYDMM